MTQQLVAQGVDVVSIDRHGGEVEPHITHLVCDLADRAAVDRNLAAIIAAGPYDMAIFNAGVNATGRLEEIPLKAYRDLTIVNAETPMLVAAALMSAGAVKSYICFVSSLSHYVGYPGAAVYAASKDALAVYAKSVRRPFARRGVSVMLACPGPMRTDHAARHAPKGASEAGRMDASEAARAILAATFAGRRLVIPGAAPRLFALAGRLAPKFVSGRMRRLIFEKLGGNVW